MPAARLVATTFSHARTVTPHSFSLIPMKKDELIHSQRIIKIRDVWSDLTSHQYMCCRRRHLRRRQLYRVSKALSICLMHACVYGVAW